MADTPDYDEYKAKIVEYLGKLEGKGADTGINIGKNVGLKRKQVMPIVKRMEEEGILMATGVTAGVAGYKLK